MFVFSKFADIALHFTYYDLRNRLTKYPPCSSNQVYVTYYRSRFTVVAQCKMP